MDLLIRLWNGLATNLDLLAAVISLSMVVYLARRWITSRLGVSNALEGVDTWVFVGAALGARAAAAIPEAYLYASHPLDLIRVNQGLSLYGALGGGALALALYGLKHKRAILSLTDAFALFLPLGIAVYRLGCLVYGFCGGKAAAFPLGIPLPGHVGTRYPSELLEGGLALGLFFILLKVSRRPLSTGTLTGLFLLLYPAVKASVDLTRFPTGPWPGADPLVSLGAAGLGLTLLLVPRLKPRIKVPTPQA